MTHPITIRADTPREAVEEVRLFLERQGCSETSLGKQKAVWRAADLLRSATIEPKPEPEPEDESAWVEKPVRGSWRYRTSNPRSKLMDDAELKRVAEAARDAEADYGHCGEGLAEGKDRQSAHMDALKEFIATFSPPTVLGLLARLSAAEARVGVLEEALQVQRGYVWMWAGDVDCGVSPTIASLQGAKYSIDAALAQEPTP